MNLAMIFGGTKTPLGYEYSKKKVPAGYSKDKAYQDQKPAGQIGVKTSSGAGRDGLKQSFSYTPYYKIESGPQAEPAPAPVKAAAPAPDLTINNPYKDEADKLLKTIKDMQDAKPKTIFSSASAVQPSNLTIASAGSQPKQTGTGSFKRRTAAKKTTTANLRTINSVNI